jgi:PAS domain S-box-containing protein
MLATALSLVVVEAFIEVNPGTGAGPLLFSAVGLSITTIGDLFRRARRQASLHAEVARRDEAALRMSEAEFRASFELGAIAKVQLDANSGCIKRVNAMFCSLTGYGPDELIGRHFSLPVPADLRADAVRVMEGVLAGTSTPALVDGRLQRKDGSKREIRASLTLVRDPAHRPAWILADVLDVTEERAATVERDAALRRTSEILDSISDAFCAIDAEWRFIYVNQHALELLGRRAEELIGRAMLEVLPGMAESEFYREARLSMADRMPRSLEFFSKHFQRWFAVGVYPHHAGGLSVWLRDISGRKEAERALAASEARYRGLLNSLPQLVWTCDRDGRCDWLSEQWCEYTGVRAGDQLEFGWMNVIHPDDLEIQLSLWRASLAAGQPFHSEARVRGADGIYRWFKHRAVPLAHAEGPPRWFGTSTDIHESMEAREALQQQEATTRLVVESAPNGFLIVDPTGAIKLLNVAAERLFGYTRSELIGQPVELLVPERLRNCHGTLRGSFHGDPRSRPMGAGRDLYGVRKDGTEFPIEIGLSPIRVADRVDVLASIVDISDRKQREERIVQALREKEVLLGEVHHRVKNNLQIVHSLLDLQSPRVVDPIALTMLRDSQNRIRSMALIHQTLYQSKDFARVDFRNFLDQLAPVLLTTYAPMAGRVRLSVQAEGVYLPIEAAVPAGLAVNEIVSNALKHGFPDGREGEIHVRLVRSSEGLVTLSVADNGVGIPAEMDLSRTDTLGLQLVTLLADQLGAELSINRRDPTRFEVTFPEARR